MNKILLSFLACLSGIVPATAQLNGNGFYRVQNFVTDRYVYITDNKGHVDVATTSVDALAIQLWKDTDKACADPATVLYFESKGGSEYDIVAQGTGIYKIIEHNVTIRKNSDGTYFAYGRQDGLVKYLGDANSSDAAEGTMSSEAKGDYRKWWIKPISADGGNYYGIKPTITAKGKHYHPVYTSFPMSAKSSGVTIHAITKYGYGMAVSEVVNGTIAANTPCYIECAGTAQSANRMNVGGNGTTVKNNQMGGVYFENYMKTHQNLTPYDRKTMRVLGVLSDGSLGFVVGNIKYLPANQSYLKVPSDAPDEIRIVTAEEYDKALKSLPSGVSLNAAEAKMYINWEYQLTASITPENASSKHINWSSSNTAVATVNANGRVKALAKGTAIITATTVNGKTATCTVTVNPVNPEAIAVSPTNYKFYVGDQYQLKATITPADVYNKTITWSTSDASVVTVDNNGLIKAVKTGSATITAKTADGKTATCAVTVNPVYPSSIALNVPETYIHSRETYQLVATLTPADVKDKSLTWTSADDNVATVDATGKVTGHATGSAVITAKSAGGASATCKINVMSPLPETVSINFDRLVMEVDDTRNLRANVTPSDAYSMVTWKTSNTGVATVTDGGQVKAVGTGDATVTATTSNGLEATCNIKVLPKGITATSVKVTPSALKLAVGETGSLSAEILPENVTNRFTTWSSNNTKIATVDAEGNVTAVSEGVCIIYAQCGMVRGSSTVTVSNKVDKIPVSSIVLNNTHISAEIGTQFTLIPTVLPDNATDKRISWVSDSPEVASVSADGVVTVRNKGVAVVTARAMDGSGVTARCTINASSGIADVMGDEEVNAEVYTIDGVLLFKSATVDDLRSLAPGIYVINHHKVLVK